MVWPVISEIIFIETEKMILCSAKLASLIMWKSKCVRPVTLITTYNRRRGIRQSQSQQYSFQHYIYLEYLNDSIGLVSKPSVINIASISYDHNIMNFC